MSLDMSQIVGLGTSIVVLAIIAVAIINGKNTAAIFTSAGQAFSSSITAATHPAQAK
jgi:hypothetical protein